MEKKDKYEAAPGGIFRKFRLILQEDLTFHEKWALMLTPFQVLLLAGVAGILLVLFTYIIVALTPLRAYVVPGYVADNYRQQTTSTFLLADSLKRRLDVQAQYLAHVNAIFRGETVDSLSIAEAGAELDSVTAATTFPPAGSEALDEMRQRVEAEDAFIVEGEGVPGESGQLLMAPLNGSISSAFDLVGSHFGIDLVAPEGTGVHAVAPGMVVFSGYTALGGNALMIQHARGLISVYKHNARLNKSTGDAVSVGEIIAVIGNTGDHSSGPHLHFELWENGQPIDPALRIRFESP
jgi:murein DD-endopeptidase MepM/ murein hydrolase activator NlpD